MSIAIIRVRVLGLVSTTRVHGPSSRAELTARVNGCQKCTRVDGLSTRLPKNAHKVQKQTY